MHMYADIPKLIKFDHVHKKYTSGRFTIMIFTELNDEKYTPGRFIIMIFIETKWHEKYTSRRFIIMVFYWN